MVDQAKYYDNYLDLFMTEGWKQYIEDTKEVLDHLDLSRAKDWDSFLILRTEIEVRDNIIGFEEELKLSMDNLKDEEDYDEEE